MPNFSFVYTLDSRLKSLNMAEVEGTFIFYVIGGNKLSIVLFHSNVLRLKEILMSQVLVWHG